MTKEMTSFFEPNSDIQLKKKETGDYLRKTLPATDKTLKHNVVSTVDKGH